MRFVFGKPALLIDDVLVVADLHIGLEQELFEKGIRIGGVRERILSELTELVKETEAKKIIILGDAKHGLLNIDFEIADFFHSLLKIAPVEIAKGNHDGNIENIAGIKVHEAEGFVLVANDGTKYGMCHGHAWPSQEVMSADYLILAHNHPTVELVDKGGYAHREHVWAVGALNADAAALAERYPNANADVKIVLVPPFNPLIGGSRINLLDSEGIGPLVKNNLFKLNDAIAYRLDGTCLGRISDLRGVDNGHKKTRARTADNLRFMRKKGLTRQGREL